MLSVIKAVFKIVGGFLLIAGCLSSASGAADVKTSREGEVTVRLLNIRSGPGKTYPVVDSAKKGSRVIILAFEPEWLKILYGTREGFVWREHIRLMPALSSENQGVPAPFDPSREPEDVQNLKQEADHIEKQITDNEVQVSSYTKKETQLIDELDRAGRLLNQTKLKVKDSREKGLLIEAALKKTEAESQSLEKEIDLLEIYSAKRLVALYKLHQLGKLPVLASADSIFDLLNWKNALDRILHADKAVWEELTTKKELSEKLRSTLDKQQREYAENVRTLSEQLETMDTQNKARSQLLDEIRGKKSLMLAAIGSLKQAATALDKEVDSYSWEVHPAGVPDDATHKKPFRSLKGLLQPPVPGKITGFYGLEKSGELKSANFNNGIDILAEPGEPIRAVYGGHVIYADWFKGYGNMIIIDHGDNYFTIYAHAQELFKAKGDPVETDEVIGTVGDTGSLAGTVLYFEIRHHGKSIDPLAWLKSN